jgi:serine/threonine protein kinase
MAPPTSVTSLAGQSIDNGRLTLIKMIGTGGYGAIYHAIDTRTRASYAVKVLEKRSNQRWTREAHLHLKVSSHPNVVTLHKILDDSGDLVYLVLDYCPGGDLNTMLMNTRIFAGENDLLKSVFLQIVGAVAHCHSKGIYHRDLKPENILCSKDGSRVFLADFGLASQSTSSTSFAVGTSQYMSPGLSTFLLLPTST